MCVFFSSCKNKAETIEKVVNFVEITKETEAKIKSLLRDFDSLNRSIKNLSSKPKLLDLKNFLSKANSIKTSVVDVITKCNLSTPIIIGINFDKLKKRIVKTIHLIAETIKKIKLKFELTKDIERLNTISNFSIPEINFDSFSPKNILENIFLPTKFSFQSGYTHSSFNYGNIFENRSSLSLNFDIKAEFWDFEFKKQFIFDDAKHEYSIAISSIFIPLIEFDDFLGKCPKKGTISIKLWLFGHYYLNEWEKLSNYSFVKESYSMGIGFTFFRSIYTDINKSPSFFFEFLFKMISTIFKKDDVNAAQLFGCIFLAVPYTIAILPIMMVYSIYSSITSDINIGISYESIQMKFSSTIPFHNINISDDKALRNIETGINIWLKGEFVSFRQRVRFVTDFFQDFYFIVLSCELMPEIFNSERFSFAFTFQFCVDSGKINGVVYEEIDYIYGIIGSIKF